MFLVVFNGFLSVSLEKVGFFGIKNAIPKGSLIKGFALQISIDQKDWYKPKHGPRYQQLHRYLADQILSGDLQPNVQLPTERLFAEKAQISRVTVRQAIAKLVSDGLVEQRRGAGSFVLPQAQKLEQSLSSLVSFTETMQARGKSSESTVLSHGMFTPTPDEVVSLGLGSGVRVARIERLRSSDGMMMAIEESSLPENILHQPEKVKTSLYAVLRAEGRAPTRALQRVTAINLTAKEARLLKMAEGAAALKIVRVGYLASGRPIELTRGIYRSDIYDFVTELRLEA